LNELDWHRPTRRGDNRRIDARGVLGVRGIRRTVLAGLASAAAIAAVVVGTASGQEDGKPLVLSVGLTQDLDSANVTVGVTVAAFEMWNLQYATLTDKAAKDFKAIPGLAQSWTSSPDKRTWITGSGRTSSGPTAGR
jgi:ABC-type transport system substrate-binding protein